MHLEGPWLSTTGKSRKPKRWASAEQKRRHEELEANWASIKAKHEPRATVKLAKAKTYQPPKLNYRGSDEPRLPSVDTGVKGAVNVRKPMQYTGDKIVGIGTMHKSNAVPIFTDQEARDISSMRR